MQRQLGYIFIILAAAQWSLVGPLCLYCLKAGMTPMEIAFWRTSVGGLLFCLHAGMTGTLRLHSVRDGLGISLFGIVCIGIMFGVYQSAVQEGGAALTAILQYTAPIWVAVASRLVFKEELTRRKILAIGISLSGVTCISLSGSNGIGNITLLAIILGVGSGVLYSGHYIVGKHYLERYSSFAFYGISMLAAAVACFPFMSIDFERMRAVWLPLLALCTICSYTSYWVYGEGLKRVEPTKAVILATLEPMLSIFVSWWWWGEFFAPAGWVGTALVMAAVFLVIIDGSRAAVRTGKAGKAA